MVRVKVRRIGNSLGVILPKDEVEAQGLEEGDEVEVTVKPALTLEDLWGRYKDPELSVDELNDLVDEDLDSPTSTPGATPPRDGWASPS